MRAVVQDRYGPPDVLYIADVAQPGPKDDEVLIRIRASTVSQSDTHARSAHPIVWRLLAGLRRPKPSWRTLGVELAGEVEAVGPAVRAFRVGDRVFGSRWFGAHAEFICLPETGAVAHMPEGVSFEEAAAICDGAFQALATLRQADVRAGQRIVIYGASGSLGTAAVQIAKHLGAHVTGVCGTDHVELVRSLGADEVVDYRHEDFTKNGQTYDAIIDAVGKYAYRWGRRSIKPGGIYVATDVGPRPFEALFLAVATRWVGSRRLKFAAGRKTRDDALYLKRLVEAGAYRPVIDRSFSMERAADAHRYVEGWHKTGNVILTIDSGPRTDERTALYAAEQPPASDGQEHDGGSLDGQNDERLAARPRKPSPAIGTVGTCPSPARGRMLGAARGTSTRGPDPGRRDRAE